MKLYTFPIAPDAQGRLLPYARRMLPEVPEYAIREAFDKRDVKVDGVRVGKDAMVVPGAEVKLYARDAEARNPVRLMYADANVAVIVKPAGVSCENDAKGGKTVAQLAQSLLGDAQAPALCHRLDNPTDGLMLLCRSDMARQELERAFRERKVHKTYTCIVKGEPSPSHATLTAWLQKDAERARVRVLPDRAQGALGIVTEYRVLQSGECSRLEVALHTGRTHQIRAHMAYIGHPLLGDDLYGDRAFNKLHKAKRLMLTATELRFALDGSLSYLNEQTFTFRPEF